MAERVAGSRAPRHRAALLCDIPAANLHGAAAYVGALDAPHVLAVLSLASVGAGLAFFLLLAELRVVQLSSGLTLSVAGVFKELLTVVSSVAFFGDALTPYNVGGLLLCVLGIVLYNRIKLKEVADSAAARRYAQPLDR